MLEVREGLQAVEVVEHATVGHQALEHLAVDAALLATYRAGVHAALARGAVPACILVFVRAGAIRLQGAGQQCRVDQVDVGNTGGVRSNKMCPVRTRLL